MRRNNKGFSLVELIVAMAIFAVAGVAIFGFMVSSSNSYNRTNKEIKLQYEQQLAVNQVRDMIVESDKGIYFDDTSKTLALYGAKKIVGGSEAYPVTVVRYAQTEGKMYFGTKDFSSVSEITFADITGNDLKLLAEDVTDFKIDLSDVENDKVQYEMTFQVGDKQRTVTETVALRNRLVVSNQVDTIWGEDVVVIESFIQGITICRGSKVFSSGDEDEIGKCGESVVVQYSAIVTANEESDRDYAVSWSMDETISGVSVSADGKVTVAGTVPSDTTRFTLRATSVDDPTKSAYIMVVVKDSGVYPESATLEIGSQTDGNGFRTYQLVVTLIYTDGNPKTDCSLFTWSGLSSLPDGCSFNEQTGKLVLSPSANGYTFMVRAEAKERKANGEPLWADLNIVVGEIPGYTVGPTVKITCATSLSRGGYVFPTMVFSGADNSNFTYDWKVEPYYDEETTHFDSIANTSFDLISLSESAMLDYNTGNMKHEMQTGAHRRIIALNCAPWLNWNKKFKVLVSGTATDYDGNVYVATSKVITIDPVKVSIVPFGNAIPEEDNGFPVLTDPLLQYEDWYWWGKTAGTDDARWQYSRRWFSMEFENIYVTANNMQGTYITHNYLFKGLDGEALDINNVGAPESRYLQSKMLCGFRKQMISWEKYVSERPAFLNFSISLKDYKGNSLDSNVAEFTIAYDFYTPQEE